MIVNLDWDSEFFGRKVGRAELVHNSLPKPEDLSGYELVYFFAAPEDAEANSWAQAHGAALVDEKVIYKKPVALIDARRDEHIISYVRRNDSTDEQVVSIGLQSGKYSRFAVDRNFDPMDFARLYTVWMNNSIDRAIAVDVLVYQQTGMPFGVLTLGEKNGNADIGILAVDHQARGKNAGRKLVEAAERDSYKRNYNFIQVVTQKANENACRFYEACGFQEDSVNNIYHWWKK